MTIQCQHCIHWAPLMPGELTYRRAMAGRVGKCLNPGNIGRGLGTVSLTDTCDLAEKPERGPTCQTCAFWTRLDSLSAPHAGKCNSPKFVFASHYHDLDVDGLMYITYDGNEADLETGEAFGCIHYQPRT